ncbi:MAG TPA: ATP-binding protein [Streptosporangiaceae bacterium]|nr:ATP-binding protein [Streptosporangiaceae bacterium]
MPTGDNPVTPAAAVLATTKAHIGATAARTFPATLDQVRQARRFLADVLAGCAVADDAVLCLSELATNAVRHSGSARPGGQFTVHVTVNADWLLVEIEDGGGTWQEATSGQECPNGRGLRIVEALTDVWGKTGDGVSSRMVWFQMPTSRAE